MRIVPIPSDLELAPFQKRGTLGPPEGMSSQDCDTVEVVHSQVALLSGQTAKTVAALVYMSADELQSVSRAGGHFWIEFIGSTFPPVIFTAPQNETELADRSLERRFEELVSLGADKFLELSGGAPQTARRLGVAQVRAVARVTIRKLFESAGIRALLEREARSSDDVPSGDMESD